MTFHEAFKTAKSWQRKVAIISLFHNKHLVIDRKWTIANTANYFCISMGLCSENLLLSREFELVKDCSSRNVALKFLRGK